MSDSAVRSKRPVVPACLLFVESLRDRGIVEIRVRDIIEHLVRQSQSEYPVVGYQITDPLVEVVAVRSPRSDWGLLREGFEVEDLPSGVQPSERGSGPKGRSARWRCRRGQRACRRCSRSRKGRVCPRRRLLGVRRERSSRARRSRHSFSPQIQSRG